MCVCVGGGVARLVRAMVMALPLMGREGCNANSECVSERATFCSFFPTYD